MREKECVWEHRLRERERGGKEKKNYVTCFYSISDIAFFLYFLMFSSSSWLFYFIIPPPLLPPVFSLIQQARCYLRGNDRGQHTLSQHRLRDMCKVWKGRTQWHEKRIEREREREREREKERVCACVWEKKRERASERVCVYVCVKRNWEEKRGKSYECVRICV